MEEIRIRRFGAAAIDVTKWKDAYVIRLFEGQSCAAAIIAFTTVVDDALTIAHEFDPAPIRVGGKWNPK